jgi:CopG family transcriptional regulator, nickel-responsive regulator
MRRITISVDDSLAEQFEALIARHGYENRSEAFRDLVRGRLAQEQKINSGSSHCIASLSYVYNHHERELASRLAALQHDHHDLCVSSMQVYLDHDDCLETIVLRGVYAQVSAFADSVIAQSGVRHGNVHVVQVELATPSMAQHRHQHFHPKT